LRQERFVLRHPGGVTELVVGTGAAAWIADELARWTAGRSVFVVTSMPVWRLHGEALGPLEAVAARWQVLEVDDGEAAKSLAVAERLWRTLSRAGGRRDSRLIAFGGGSVGDLAGFVAGCFLRGIAFCQVPTTAIAQVDAAVGGKTAVNLPEAKNSVGLFHHPDRVLTDPAFLATLPRRDRRAGLVEVLKMAVLLDLQLLESVELSWEALDRGESAAWLPVVTAAQRLKAALVEADPWEGGRRRLLNFGHTLAHALESVLGYQGLGHGEAVAWGLRFALRLGRRQGMDGEVADRLGPLLDRLEPPPLPALDPEALWSAISRDKKADQAGVRWVLAERLGRGVERQLEPEVAREELVDFLASAGRGW
jgi:3-dehydroquinate synthase